MKARQAIKYLFAISAVTLSLLLIPRGSQAASSNNVMGYAWSSNIGWISLNCNNDSSCGTVQYGVNENNDGTLTGYAWSSTIGWIQFGGLSGFPSGSGTYAQNAKLSGNEIHGWIRAVSHDSSWDGWISLWGSGYGMSQSNGVFGGYAWGSSVVGWVEYNVAVLNSSAKIDAQISGASVASSTTVAFGSNVSLVWTLTNMPFGATCSVTKTSSGGTAFTPITNITTSGSGTTGSLLQGSYTYQIQCQNGVTVLATQTVSFTVLAQPPGFVITGPNSLNIQFLNQNGADSQAGSYFVDNGGTPYSNSVSVSVTGINPNPPSGTTVTYSLNGGAFSANPAPVVISSPYSSGVSFKAHFSANPGTTTSYTVTLTGTGSGAPNATDAITIIPVQLNPIFQEQ